MCSVGGSLTSVRAIKLHEIAAVVGIHMAALPDDVLPNLGRETLTRYYKRALSSSNNKKVYMVGAFKGQILIGFCQIAFKPVSLFNIIKIDTIFRIIFLVLSRPGVFLNGLIQYLMTIDLDEKSAELAFIAILPSYQSAGVGKRLILEAKVISAEQGKEWIVTKTANKRLSEYYINRLHARKIKSFRGVGVIYNILKWSSAV